MPELWELDKYQSGITSLTNRTIIEYDMKSAHISLAKEFHLLPNETIEKLESMSKRDRVVANGKLKRDNKEYSENEKRAFIEARRLFFEKNDITIDDVVSIKRDAIFVTKYVQHEKVGEYINFRKKNEYTSYMYIKPLELYYSSKNGIDVKGIDDEIYKEFHKEYFGHILETIFKKMETSETSDILKHMRIVIDKYKWLEYETGVYREFNNLSNYRYIDGSVSKEEYLEDITQLDISFNFQFLVNVLGVFF